MRRAALALCIAFTGCAAPYAPEPLEIIDPEKYTAAVIFCQVAAANYKPKLSAGKIAQGALMGGTGSLSYAPINPAIPALGAVGGAAGAASAGITGQARRNVHKHCLEDKVRLDGSAILANPEN